MDFRRMGASRRQTEIGVAAVGGNRHFRTPPAVPDTMKKRQRPGWALAAITGCVRRRLFQCVAEGLGKQDGIAMRAGIGEVMSVAKVAG